MSKTVEWRKVKDFSKYEVNYNGEVRNTSTKHVLTRRKNKSGQIVVGLAKDNGMQTTIAPHILVARAFIDNPKKYYYVRHKDKDKNNNKASNLEWFGSDIKKKGKEEVKEKEQVIIDPAEYKVIEDGNYCLYRDGRLQNEINGNFLKGSVKNGYLNFYIKINGERKNISANQLVGIHFISNPKEKPYVNHKDGNKLNNHVDNLEWATQEENIQDAIKNNLIKFHSTPVLKYSIKGEFLERFNSTTEAGKSVGLSRYAVEKVCSGKNKTCAGFVWKYEKPPEKVDLTNTVPIKDYPNYLVSPEGWVYSKNVKRKMKGCKTLNGYEYLTLCKERKEKNVYVHIIVANAFLPNPERKKQVNHIDENKLNNNVKNLEWATQSENIMHSINLKKKRKQVSATKQQ